MRVKENAYSSEKPLGEVAINTEERKMGFIFIYCFPQGLRFIALEIRRRGEMLTMEAWQPEI